MRAYRTAEWRLVTKLVGDCSLQRLYQVIEDLFCTWLHVIKWPVEREQWSGKINNKFLRTLISNLFERTWWLMVAGLIEKSASILGAHSMNSRRASLWVSFMAIASWICWYSNNLSVLLYMCDRSVWLFLDITFPQQECKKEWSVFNPFQPNDAVRRHGHTRSFFRRLVHVSGIVRTACVSNCIHNTHRKPILRSWIEN